MKLKKICALAAIVIISLTGCSKNTNDQPAETINSTNDYPRENLNYTNNEEFHQIKCLLRKDFMKFVYFKNLI